MNVSVIFMVYLAHTHLIQWQSFEVDFISISQVRKLSLKSHVEASCVQIQVFGLSTVPFQVSLKSVKTILE